ncbi:MAG: DUF262 domain-containing protein [Candidatus Methanomethylophilaceae archaeon]|nr:DUF262 domain-containing protein [Candidatus Methanomethylophilaceae archaeon]
MKWSDKAIKELFTNNLTIPEYQRSFSWTEDNIDDFFTDLKNFITRKDEYYLFGQIIIHHDDTINYIVDGQQRITTSTIFLCVIRDILKERKYDIDSLRTKINNAIGFADEQYRLTSGYDSREFFMNYVQGANHDYKPKRDIDRKLKNAYQQLYDQTIEYIGNDDESPDKLKILATRFLDGFHISYVETDSLSQAFTVFETLNARGSPLEVPDLLKNHFFSRLDKNHEYIKNNWIEMVDKISKIGPKATTQFIKYYWNSLNEFIREKELFDRISKIPDADLYDFLKGLFDSEELYIEIVNPDSKSTIFDDDTVDCLKNLKQFGASSFCPLVIALYNTDNKC